jgi:hypothetical protein
LTIKIYTYIIVVTMFIDDQTYTQNGKIYRRALLRNSYRVNGKVCHDTIANLSQCSDEEIEAIKLALKHKGDLKKLVKATDRTSGAIEQIDNLTCTAFPLKEAV